LSPPVWKSCAASSSRASCWLPNKIPHYLSQSCQAPYGKGERAANGGPNDLHNPNGCSAAKETAMKRFLKNVFAIMRKTNESKPSACSQRPNPTPLVEVRSQVKAGSFQWGVGRG